MRGEHFGRVQITNGEIILGYAWGLMNKDEFQVVYAVAPNVWGECSDAGELSLIKNEAESFDTTVPAPDAALTALAIFRLTGEVTPTDPS